MAMQAPYQGGDLTLSLTRFRAYITLLPTKHNSTLTHGRSDLDEHRIAPCMWSCVTTAWCALYTASRGIALANFPFYS